MDGLMDGLWMVWWRRLGASSPLSLDHGGEAASRLRGHCARSSVVGNRARAPRYGALATAVLATAALVGTAAPSQGSSASSRAATIGRSYGGVTSQDFPVVIRVNRRRSRVVRAVIAISTSCTAGGLFITPDGYTRPAQACALLASAFRARKQQRVGPCGVRMLRVAKIELDARDRPDNSSK
jgi:hypothetical protein